MTTMAAATYRCESIGSSTMSNDISTFNITNNLTAELDSAVVEPFQVYLRIRSQTSEEIANQVPTLTYDVQEQKHLILQPTQSLKSKMSQCCHRFTFSKIFDCCVNQQEIFNCTAKEIVQEFSEGNNRLIFNYGVTNAGKTFTMQGSNNEPGIIPRSLDYVFQRYSSQLSSFPKYKPQDGTIVKLSWAEAMKENKIKNECLKLDLSSSVSLSSTSNISTFIKSNGSISTDDDSQLSTVFGEYLSNDSAGSYTIWISFVEIYNEQIFDLLGSIGNKTRKTLKLRESENGSSFLQGITEIFVNSAEEAYKILRNGRQVLRQASTKLNHFSSRSHCIFTVKLIRHCNSELATSINQLSFCDLAGSERTSKTHTVGQRLREAGVINTSLMVLGRCIFFLRQNQSLIRENPLIVPFRDSKLTMMFKAFLTGHGKTSMLINISPCANMFDETLHVLKFSAMAKELSLPIYPVHLPKVTRKSLNNLRLSLLGDRTSIAWQTSMCETEIDEDSDAEGNVKLENALEVIDLLNKQIANLENDKLQLEIDLREELCSQFAAQLKDTEDYYRDRINEEEERYEQMASKRINNLEDYYLNKKCEECAERLQPPKLCDTSVQYEVLQDSANMEVEEKSDQLNHANFDAINQSFAEKLANLEKELMEANAERLLFKNQLKAIEEEKDKPAVTLHGDSIEVDLKECSTNTAETQTSLIEDPNSAIKIELDAETQTSLLEEPDGETKSQSDAKNLSLRKSLYYSLSSSSVSGDEVFKHPLSQLNSKDDDVAVSKIPEEVVNSLTTISNMQNQMNDIHGNVEELLKQATAKTSFISESENLPEVVVPSKEEEKDSNNVEIKDLLSQIKVDTQSIKENLSLRDEEKEKNIPDQSDNNEIIINASVEIKDILSQLRAEVSRLKEIDFNSVKLTQPSTAATSVAEACTFEQGEFIELPAMKTSQMNENSRESKKPTAGHGTSRKLPKSPASSKGMATNEEAEDELPGTSSQQDSLSSYTTPMKTINKIANGSRKTRTRQKGIQSIKKENLNALDSFSEDEVPSPEVRTTKKRKVANQKKSKKLELDDDSFEVPPRPLKQLRRYDKMAISISPPVAAAPETKPNVHQKVLRSLRQRK